MTWLKRPRPQPVDDEAALLTTSAFPHAGMVKADPWSFQATHRRMAWLLRLSAGTNIILGASLVMALSAWIELVPLKTTEFVLVKTDPGENRIYRVEPPENSVQGLDLLLENTARRYVRILLEIDSVTQTERFQEAFRMTDQAFYERFKKERLDSKEVRRAIDSGLTRSITVESVDRIETAAGTYKYAADLVQTDERKGEVVEVRKLRAYLNLTLRPQSIRTEDREHNPLGITVLDLVLKERGNS